MMESITQTLQGKSIESANLQAARLQISTQNAELLKKNNLLYQHYQRQQNEITVLNENIRKLSLANQSLASQAAVVRKSQITSSQKLSTKKNISEEEYRSISNQNEYIYVRSHLRNGKRVAAHYRRKGKR